MAELTTKQGTPGSVSNGTMNPRDLIPTFMFLLEDLDPKRATTLTMTYSGDGWPYSMDGLSFGEYIDENPEQADELLNDLFDALDECSPAGFSFGSHPGDGADYGYWGDEDGMAS